MATVLVVLDDLQWADPASLELLDYISSDLGDLRLMIVATYRTPDPSGADQVAEVLADLGRHRWVRRVDLVGLDAASLSTLLEAFGGRPDAEIVGELNNRTRGNPFFVVETLRLIDAANGAINADTLRRVVPTPCRASSGAGSPAFLRTPPPQCRPPPCSVTSSSRDRGGSRRGRRGHDASTTRACRAGRPVRRSARWRWPIPILPWAGAGNPLRWHRSSSTSRAPTAAPARRSSDATARPPARDLLWLADHWRNAVPAAPPAKAIEYARRSATWLLGNTDHRHAEQQLRIVLELVAIMPADDERAMLELDILDQQAQIAGSALTTYTSEELGASMARTRELCATVADSGRLVPALWRMASFHLARAEFRAGTSVGHELIALAASVGDTGASLAGHTWVGIMLTHRGDLAAARHHLAEAIELGDAGHASSIGGLLEDPVVFARAFSAVVHVLLGDETAADADVERGLAAAGRAALVRTR